MILGVDHLAIAVPDPDEAISELAAFLLLTPGVGGGRHPKWGTRNRLLWLGDTYIELATVFDPRLAERSWFGRAMLRALREGDGAFAWAIATDDLVLDRAQLNAGGASLGDSVAGERRRPDGRVVRWQQALPPEVDLERPFLIEHDLSAAEWTPEDRAERSGIAGRLVELALPVETIVGLRPAAGVIELGDQRVRVAGEAAGLPTVVIGGLGRGGASAELLGCRWLVD